MIRPSFTHGLDYYIITWKFFEKVIVHLQIKEEKRAGGLPPIFIMNSIEYECFEEIID